MAKSWYPVIDYLTCTECGSCVAKCSHNVFDHTKAPTPVVTQTVACIDHCHGCGNLCPVGAITYVGEDTGWTPPNDSQATENTCCSCGCNDVMEKKVLIEYLYLDLQTCDRCIGTGDLLDEVVMTITPALTLAGYHVEYHKIEIETEKLANQYQFLSSPTIRVNGIDICKSVEEDSCDCCSDISGTDVNCRVFNYNDKTYQVPPKEMLAEEILRMVFDFKKGDCSCENYKLPENLKTFFSGKEIKKCSCGGGCC